MIDLIESGKTQSALKYLKEQTNFKQEQKQEYCMHPSVNSILNLWANKARENQIEYIVNVRIPEKVKIEPMELSALFSNAIENAFNANMNLTKEIKKKHIKIEANYNQTNNRLAIGICNTCNDDIIFEQDIPKSKREFGGIGTRSMTYTVKRYQGTYSFSANDGIFKTRFVLNV